MNFTYKFVRLPVLATAPEAKHPHHESYVDVIHAHAKDGWRFVQLVHECPPTMPSEFVLIFEKQSDSASEPT
ncbi:MAG: DUF4177 domain-containing protein [Pseudanabaena sp.]|jgi:hypothetical protein